MDGSSQAQDKFGRMRAGRFCDKQELSSSSILEAEIHGGGRNRTEGTTNQGEAWVFRDPDLMPRVDSDNSKQPVARTGDVEPGSSRKSNIWWRHSPASIQEELYSDPTPTFESYCDRNGMSTAIQMGGLLPYN